MEKKSEKKKAFVMPMIIKQEYSQAAIKICCPMFHSCPVIKLLRS